MADDQQRARPAPQRPFQPLDRADVEVVGRLVQHQQIRPRQQQTRQQRARFLPAAQLHQRRRVLAFAEAESLQRRFGAHFVIVAANPLEFFLKRP